MAKKPAKLVSPKKTVEEPKMAPGVKTEGPKPAAPAPKPAMFESSFDWSGFLVPNGEKLLRFLLVMFISFAVLGFFVYLKNISMQSTEQAVMNLRSLLFILVCYIFACYTQARGLSRLQTVVMVLIPELLIVAYLFMKLQVTPTKFGQ